MCEECEYNVNGVVMSGEEFNRTPRIDLELLDAVWREIETRVITQGVTAGLTLGDIRNRNSLDGWNQGNWRCLIQNDAGEVCGTAMCFAGWAAHLDALRRGDMTGGWLMSFDEILEAPSRYNLPIEAVVAVPEDNVDRHRVHDGVHYVTAEYRGQRVLGLVYSEAERLFRGSNTFEKVQEHVINLRQEELMRRARHDAWTAAQKAAATPAPAAPATAQDGDVE